MKANLPNKVLVINSNKAGTLVCVRLLSDEAMEGKHAGDVVYVDMATADKLIAGYFAEMAEE